MLVKTLFVGSNYEALETLKTLNNHESFDLVGVITQPDKPVGRKQEIVETDINRYCVKNNLKVFYTNNDIEKYKEALEIFKPELIVCKSFGEIIPEFFLHSPKYGAINIHFSLLPKYRGAVPIQMALLNGDEETGISIIKMEGDLDSGEIIGQFKEKILQKDTNFSLRKRLVEKTTIELPNILLKWVSGEIDSKKQNEDEVTYCWKKDISKENARIDWEKHSAKEIDRMVRAFIPWPIAWTMINGKRVKIFEVNITNNLGLQPKEFLQKEGSLFVGTAEGTIEILELQMEGKKQMSIKTFLQGFKVASIQ